MKLPKFIFDKVKTHNTSLGDNDAFPLENEYPFDYKILKKRFNDVCENLSKLNIDLSDIDAIETYASYLLKKIKDIELPIRNNLEKLCINVVNEQLSVPDETIILNCEIVDDIKPNNNVRIIPEDTDGTKFEFEDLNDINNLNKVILKRRLINSLIQGASYNCNKLFMNELNRKLSEFNDELPYLYDKITIINDYLLFVKEEKITDKKPSQCSCVEVMLGRENEKTEINVQGLIFPYLLSETFRGFFELFASHGLPEDNEKASYIIKQSDFLLAEPWDLRFGVELWNILSKKIDNNKILPYFFTSLCEMNVDEFNESLKEIFSNTKKGKKILNHLIDDSNNEFNHNLFIDTIKTKNTNSTVLNDSYISSDEIDDYVIEEDGTINENAIDKFNSDTSVKYLVLNTLAEKRICFSWN